MKSMNIRTKLFMTIMLVVLVIVLLLGTVFRYVVGKMLYKDSTDFAQEFIEQVYYNLEDRTQSLRDSTFEFMSSPDFLNLVQNDTELVKDGSLRVYQRKMREIGGLHFTNLSYVEAFYVRGSGGEYSWWQRNGIWENPITDDLARQRLDIAETHMNGKNTAWFVSGDTGKYYLSRNIISTGRDLGAVQGTIVFEIDENFFDLIDENGLTIRDQDLIFQDPNTKVEYGTYLFSDIDKENGLNNVGSGIYDIRISGEKYVLIARKDVNKRWNIYCLLPMSRLMESVNYEYMVLFLIVLAAALAGCILAYIVSGSLSRNIRNLAKEMERVSKGDFGFQLTPPSSDEVGHLYEEFNAMSAKIQSLVDHAYEEGIEKQKLQLQVLKAQINPHFLYNSLGSIRSMAKMHGMTDIEIMTNSLIRLLRISLGKTGEYHTVAEEVEYVRNYFVMQLYRYENMFRVTYDVADEVKDCYMLSFILQPLAENALFHGIEISKGNGEIRISADKKDGKLLLQVADNGVGMSEEKIAEVLRTNENQYEGLNSIGVSNVSSRIKQYFDEEYGLVYKSSPGDGCIVEVWLPLFRTKEEAKAYV